MTQHNEEVVKEVQKIIQHWSEYQQNDDYEYDEELGESVVVKGEPWLSNSRFVALKVLDRLKELKTDVL